MENINMITLGQIVTRNNRAAEILEKFGLDFCCSGEQLLVDACKSRGVDVKDVTQALSDLKSANEVSINFDEWPLDFLADYIYNKHHKFIEEMTPVIKAYLEKICVVHGVLHPELLEIKRIFDETSGELAAHMKKEELLLFPYIRNLVKAKATGSSVSSRIFKSVVDPILSMKSDHASEGEQLHLMAELSHDFTPPPGACNTYVITYQLLKEYEKDMHMHMHLENNVLFSRAILLEKELRVKSDE